MNNTQKNQFLQRWTCVQEELIPTLGLEMTLTPKLEKLIHILEWIQLEEFICASWCGMGRPPHERFCLANAFIAKVILNIPTNSCLLDRLSNDRALQRLCGFPPYKKLPSESTFSRAFAEFAQSNLAERVHDALIKTHLGNQLIGHISRDGTAIAARERPVAKPKADKDKPKVKTRGRPRKGENRPPKKSALEHQQELSLEQMLAQLPTDCHRGSKCNAQGYKNSWNGYKLHIDTADCGVPVAAVLSSASMHDSLAAMPLSLISQQRVTNLYDLMDAAYCSEILREQSRSLGHIPLIDHNPRRGEKKEFSPHEAKRYQERSVAERMNARLKDEFGGRNIWVRGAQKVKSHLMFGLLALSADQLMRLRY